MAVSGVLLVLGILLAGAAGWSRLLGVALFAAGLVVACRSWPTYRQSARVDQERIQATERGLASIAAGGDR
jgi:hypothetical protein